MFRIAVAGQRGYVLTVRELQINLAKLTAVGASINSLQDASFLNQRALFGVAGGFEVLQAVQNHSCLHFDFLL